MYQSVDSDKTNLRMKAFKGENAVCYSNHTVQMKLGKIIMLRKHNFLRKEEHIGHVLIYFTSNTMNTYLKGINKY